MLLVIIFQEIHFFCTFLTSVKLKTFPNWNLTSPTMYLLRKCILHDTVETAIIRTSSSSSFWGKCSWSINKQAFVPFDSAKQIWSRTFCFTSLHIDLAGHWHQGLHVPSINWMPNFVVMQGTTATIQVYSCWVDAKSRDCSWFSNYYPIALPWWVLPDLATRDLGSQLREGAEQQNSNIDERTYNMYYETLIIAKCIVYNVFLNPRFSESVLVMLAESGLGTINPACGMGLGQTRGTWRDDFTWHRWHVDTQPWVSTWTLQGTLSELTWYLDGIFCWFHVYPSEA